MIAPIFKEQLMTSLAEAVDSFNKGSAPNDAVAKAAAAADFNVEQTRRLCETFNTARTIHHFNTHPDSKEATFDLADPGEVLAVLFNEHGGVKAAQAPDADVGLNAPTAPGYEAYDQQERGTPLGPSFPLDQTALPGDTADLSAAPEALPSLDAQAYRARRMINSQEQLATEGDEQADSADLLSGAKLGSLANDIAQDYWRSGAHKLATFLRASSVADRGTLGTLCEYLPKGVSVTTEDLLKCGTVVDSAPVTSWLARLSEVTALAKQAGLVRKVAQQLRAETQEFEQKFAALVIARPGGRSEEDPFAGLAKLAAGPEGKPATKDPAVSDAFGFKSTWDALRVPTQEARTSLSKRMEVPTAGVGSAVQDFINQGVNTIFNDPRQRAENKAVSARLRNQQREVILHDLVLNDPYLAEADPERIASTYQAIWQIAPEASLNKEVVRAVLRQGVHTPAFSPYDAASLADLEKTIREVQGTLPGRQEGKK